MARCVAVFLLYGVVTCLSFGCDTDTSPTFTVSPEIIRNPNPQVPLAAIVSAETGEPTTLRIHVREGAREWTLPTASVPATTHSVPVLGFKPDRQHSLEVTAIDAQGNASAIVTLALTTPPLPEDFPELTVLVSKPESMEPGVTLFSLMRWPDGAPPDEEYSLAIAVDERGEVVWYRTSEPLWEDPHRMANGNLLGIVGYNRADEVDMLGNVVTSWHASEHPNPEADARVPEGSIPVATETFHHDIQEMPSGNLLVLSTEMRRIEEYPTAVDQENAETAPANVIGDVVVEFARDGSIVNEWKLIDMLDVNRLGYESLGDIWDRWAYVEVEGGTKDWAHANSVWYDPATESILVSVRHQEAVISFSRETGELNWILGTHEGWGDAWSSKLLSPEDELEWPYHQHAAEVTESGSLFVFDNGNFRAMPPEPALTALESYSRAVEYMIDPESRSVRELWVYGPEQEVFYSPFISEADLLPLTGNVLITDGGRIRDEEGRPSDQIVGGEHWARIVEVTRSAQPEKVFEIIINAQTDESEIGWAVYRSERLPSLYAE